MTACCQPCQSCALRHVLAWLPAWLAAWPPCQRPTDLMATILHPHPTATGAGPMRGATSSSCCAAQCRMMVTVTGLDSAFEARLSWICAVGGFEATHLCGCAELKFLEQQEGLAGQPWSGLQTPVLAVEHNSSGVRWCANPRGRRTWPKDQHQMIRQCLRSRIYEHRGNKRCCQVVLEAMYYAYRMLYCVFAQPNGTVHEPAAHVCSAPLAHKA